MELKYKIMGIHKNLEIKLTVTKEIFQKNLRLRNQKMNVQAVQNHQLPI